MEKKFNSETWSNLLEKFSSYVGSVSSFCQENKYFVKSILRLIIPFTNICFGALFLLLLNPDILIFQYHIYYEADHRLFHLVSNEKYSYP